MNQRDNWKERSGANPRGSFQHPQKPPAPVVPKAPTAAPGAAKMDAAGLATYTKALDKFRSSRPKTWAQYNDQCLHQDRVIAVKLPEEGRYVHSSCADEAAILPPGSRPAPTTIPTHMIGRVASSGGLICSRCNTFIVPPTTRRGIDKAEADWDKANDSFKKSEITVDAFRAAAERYISFKEGTPETPAEETPTED